jgi:tRNA A-37 threonylcarbamoyl transferase component Bud32/tetratricopeptide (TPR) repeat protein
MVAIEAGFRIGRYEVMEHLATGGMATVYKAVDRELGRPVALKILTATQAELDLATERFRREARHAARLNHPNIVTLYEFGRDHKHDLSFLAFEFIHGIDLARYIASRGRLYPEEVRRILIQVARALAHAFEHGVVHRDIKPSNIMLTRIAGKVRVKLTDLGLAITLGADEFRVTREGNTVGTIDYLAPEQARNSQAVDTRSDIYALGCTAYHMLAGKAPFAEGGLGERLFKHLEAVPVDVRQFNSAVSAGLWAILAKMLAKSPEDRYGNPLELLRALKQTNAEKLPADGESIPIHSERRPTQHDLAGSTKLATTKPQEQKENAARSLGLAAAAGAVTTEQAQAAAAFYKRAIQVATQGGGDDYARELLDECLKLDPFNLAARKALRALHQKNTTGVLGRWLGSLNVLATKSKMRLARSQGDWRKVFEHGEQVLARQPSDTDTHIELAETASEIGMPGLARWLLEQGCEATKDVPEHAQLLRALARLHEYLREWQPAIDLWQQVVKLEPTNCEAHRKVNDLLAQQLVTCGHYNH